jgi:uncharacterized protein (TIGR04222 family)
VDRYPIDTWVVWPMLVTVAVTTVAGYVWMRRAATPVGAPPDASSVATRDEVGLLRGLPDRPVIAALAWLRAVEALEATEHGTIVVRRPPPPGAGPLDEAVHRAVVDHGRWDGIDRDPRVVAAVDSASRAVVASGWVANNADPRVRSRALLTVAVVLVEIAVFMTVGGTSVVATAVCLSLPLVVLLPLLLAHDDLSPAGRRTVRRAFCAVRRLPRHDADRLALEVALHGLPALRSAYPRLVIDGRVYERRPPGSD